MNNKRRIISCTPSTTDILIMLGLGDNIIAADEQSMTEPPNSHAKSLGPVDNINHLMVATLNPDLVIATDSVAGSEAVIDTMKQVGLPIITLHSERFDDMLADIYTIGVECGVEQQARELVEKLHLKIKQIVSQVRPGENNLRVYFEWFPNPFTSSGSQSWINDMIKKSGAVNIFGEFPNPTLLPDEDEIIVRDPQAIFICWIGQGDDIEDMEIKDVLRRKGWDEVQAIRKKQVYFLPESLFTFPGPRIVEGLELLIELTTQIKSGIV